jgi:hypothetical protein
MLRLVRVLVVPVAFVGVLAALAVACSSTPAALAGTGGPVSGPADVHCNGQPPQASNQSDCQVTPADGGVIDVSPYGANLYNAEGDDDACKYHVSWTYTPIVKNQDVTFTVTGVYLATGTPDPPACAGCPMAGITPGASSNFYAEVSLPSQPMHPPPSTNQVVTVTKPGTYTVGPVQFDVSGQWLVRFHFYDTCTEVAKDSPHGHAAFYVEVP